MVTVHRAHGFDFVIYPNDHRPAHVHVIGDGEVIISLRGADGEPVARANYGVSRGDFRRLFAEVKARQAYLLNHWEKIHGPIDG